MLHGAAWQLPPAILHVQFESGGISGLHFNHDTWSRPDLGAGKQRLFFCMFAESFAVLASDVGRTSAYSNGHRLVFTGTVEHSLQRGACDGRKQ